jgi:tetratricopeptide (TPR) repeat protein
MVFRVSAGPLTLVIGVMFVMSAVIIFGALKMKNVDSFGWAVASAIGAMLIGPGNLVGVPIGIWALSELFRPGVRELFGADANSPREIPMLSKRRRRVVVCGAILMVVFSFTGALVLILNLIDQQPAVKHIQPTLKQKTVAPIVNPDFKRAEEFYQRALARNPKEFDAAIADLSEAIRLAEKPEYYGNRGRRYILRGQENSDKADYHKAIDDFTEAIRQAPKMADYWNQRGWAYLNKEDWRKALADIDEAIQLAPLSATCYSNRGWAYKLKGDYAAALLDLNKAIEQDSRHAPAYQLRGDVNLQQKEYDRALADYNQAIQIDRTYAVAFQGRGQVHQALGLLYQSRGEHDAAAMFDKALDDLNRAILLRPSNAKAYLIRSEIYASKGDKANSDVDHAEAIRRDPSLAKEKK